MEAARYQRFIDELTGFAANHREVIGLVALGSTASVSHAPDEFSDHDFWLVVAGGTAAKFRADVGWLPDPHRIVGLFVETEHGRSVVYDDGHLVELAVFEEAQLEVTRVNDYRILYDASGITDRLGVVAEQTATAQASGSADRSAGRFVTQLLIGLGRYGRGELLSADQLIRDLAVASLLEVVAESVPAEEGDVLDNLDPRRRFELAYPTIAGRVSGVLAGSGVEVAQELLDIAIELHVDLPALSPAVVAAVQAAIDRARSAVLPPARLHHVQLAMPAGTEGSARRFYAGLLGLDEVAKPSTLAARGGCWFRGPRIEIHLGVADPFVAADKAHAGILVGDIDELAVRLNDAGHGVRWDPHFPGHRRFYTNDPFGNRVEFLEVERRADPA